MIGIVLLTLPIAVPVIKTSAKYSMFNTGWNGCSEFAKLLFNKGKIIPIFYPYDSVRLRDFKGALIIVGPDIDFSKLEVEEVKAFLEKGGIIFIADDFGTANTLLEKLDVNIRISNKKLIDLFYSKRVEFPIVVRISKDIAVEKVVLNEPSFIIGGRGLAYTSKVSSVDGSMNSYPILAEVKYGKGKIIVLSDPDVLINDMFQENRKFIENLIDYLGVKTFYFDEAHHSDFNHTQLQQFIFIESLIRVRLFKFSLQLLHWLFSLKVELLVE